MLDLNIFFPEHLKIYAAMQDKEEANVKIFSCQKTSECPVCRKLSGNIHSSYSRRLMDLPIVNLRVELKVLVRKFYCKNKECKRKVFTERFSSLIRSYARRTDRLDELLTMLAFSSSAEIETKISQKLNCKISADTFLNLIRKTPINEPENIENIGVDDWSYKKGKKYGSLICDLNSRKPIAMLKDRSSETLEEWLEKTPNLKIVCRDRSSAYAKAINNKCPNAVQIADRFHLVKNLLDAVKEYMKRRFASTIEIGFEKKQKKSKKKKVPRKIKASKAISEGQQKKIQLVHKIKKLHSDGMAIDKIHRETHLARETIRRYIKLDAEIVSRYNLSVRKYSKYHRYEKEIIEYLHNNETSLNISRILQKKGLKHADTGLARFVRQLRSKLNIPRNIPKSLKNTSNKIKAPIKKAIWITRFKLTQSLWMYREKLSDGEVQDLEKTLKKYPLSDLYELIQRFRIMMKEKNSKSLKKWIEDARNSKIDEIQSFAKGLEDNWTEVFNAFIYPYSNGLLEGHINRLKVIKRQAYGRANFDLLAKKVLYSYK